MVTVTVQDNETGEIKQLLTLEYIKTAKPFLHFFEDGNGQSLTETFPPFDRMPPHLLAKGGIFLLGSRLVTVISIVRD